MYLGLTLLKPITPFDVLLMWSPGLAALTTVKVVGFKVSSLGWSWGSGKWEVIGYLIPFGWVAVGYSIVWSTGLGGFGDPEYI